MTGNFPMSPVPLSLSSVQIAMSSVAGTPNWRSMRASSAAWRCISCLARALFANDLDQHSLAAPSVELAIKNLLPRTEVEFPRRDRDDNLPPHNLAFHMGIGIVLAGSVMTVARNRLMRCQPFKPTFVVGVQPLLVIVDENGCGNVHGIDERYALLNAALLQGRLDAPAWCILIRLMLKTLAVIVANIVLQKWRGFAMKIGYARVSTREQDLSGACSVDDNGRWSADEYLADFDDALQPLTSGTNHRPALLVQQIPRRAITPQPQHPLQAQGAGPPLLTGYVRTKDARADACPQTRPPPSPRSADRTPGTAVLICS
jgi:hypothetical protein